MEAEGAVSIVKGKGRMMNQVTVKWIIEGEMTVEADTVEAAEEQVHKELVKVLTDPQRWPEALGARSIQGAGAPAEKSE
jgi:hypothetical protein